MEYPERSNHCRNVVLNIQKPAEVTAAEMQRIESVGVSNMIERGGSELNFSKAINLL